MEGERRGDWGNPTSGFQSNPSDCCESLCCRISFISYWCYLVLSWLLSACNSNLGALRRGQVFVKCVCGRVCTCAAVVSDNTFTTDLISIPFVRRLSPRLSNQREIWRQIFSSVFPVILRSLLRLSLYFSICVLLQPLLNVIGACTAICWIIC